MNKFSRGLITFISLALISVFTAVTSLAAPSTVQIFVDDSPLVTDQSAVIRNSRTMVPFNALFSALGADVKWNEAQQKVTGTKGELNVDLFIGKANAVVNGKSVTMDTPVQIINSRTMVPLAFVSNYLGAAVRWDGVNYIAYVSTNSLGIFDPGVPAEPAVPVTPSPSVPGITAPVQDTAAKSNVLSGTYVAENMKKERFAIQFNSSMTIDIKNLTTGKEGKGTYTVTGDSVGIQSDFFTSSYLMENLTYNGRKIILLKEISTSGIGTIAITPVTYEEFAKTYISNN